jgi:uncharacterized protein (DUF488 family)
MSIFTLGHSNHTPERFFELLAPFRITHILDIRSKPFSRHVPHFNRDSLSSLASERGYIYEWWGESLGGYRDNAGVDVNDDPVFKKAIENLAMRFGESSDMAAVLVCAEGDPAKCHRANLIGPALRALPSGRADLQHILPDGTLIAQSLLEERGAVSRLDRSGTLSLF